MEKIEKTIGKETEKRKSVLKDLFLFMKNTGRFSVLVLGERGTGKTKWVKQFADVLKEDRIKWCNNLITASCSSFGKDDLNAEAELFGYEKGAFTGSNPKGKEGLFIEADKGFLFLDELHHLSLKVQAKLLTVLQTESSGKNQGKFPVRKIHSSENKYVEVRVIFGSNLPIEKLKETLLPDLYDRIAQLVIELPPLEKNEIDLKKYFTQIFKKMNQKEEYTSDSKKIAEPKIEDFYKWIPTINLEGNFRDLEKIAILWGQLYLKHKDKAEVEIFNDVKTYYEKSNPSIMGKFNNISFSLTKTYEYYLEQFQKQYAEFISTTLIYKNARQGDRIKEVGRTKKVIQEWLKL